MTKHRNGTPHLTLSALVSPTTPTVISNADRSRIDSGHEGSITTSPQRLLAKEHQNHCPQESETGRTALLEYTAADPTANGNSSVELEQAGRPLSKEFTENCAYQDFDAREKKRSNYTTIESATDLKAPVEFKDSSVGPEPACTERCELSEIRSTEASNHDRERQAAAKSRCHINGEQREAEEDFYADERTILLEIDMNEFYYDKENDILIRTLSTTPEVAALSELLLDPANKQLQSDDSTPTRGPPVATASQGEEIREATRIPDGPFVTSAADLNAIFPPTPEALSTWKYPAYIRKASRTLPESWETPKKDEPFVYPPGKPAPYLDPALRGEQKNEYDLYGEYHGYCGYGAYTGYMFRPDSNCGSDSEEEEGVLGAADVYRDGGVVNGNVSPALQLPPSEASLTDRDSGPAWAPPPVESAFPLILEDRILEWLEDISVVPRLDRLQLQETEGKAGEAMKAEVGDQERGRQGGRQDEVKARYGGATEGQLSENIDRGKVAKIRVKKAPVTVSCEHLMEEEENALTCEGCQERTNNMCLYCNRCHASCCIHQVTLDMLQEATRVRLAAEKVKEMAKMRSDKEDRIRGGEDSLPKQRENEHQWDRERPTGAKPCWAWYHCSS